MGGGGGEYRIEQVPRTNNELELFLLYFIAEDEPLPEKKVVDPRPWRANMKASTEKPPDEEKPEPEVKKVDEDEVRPWRKNMKKLEDQVPGESQVLRICQ